MKIAFTGAESTGKTTLVEKLYNHPEFREFEFEFVTADARSILDSMGCKLLDNMSCNQIKEFQRAYFDKKKHLEKEAKGNIIVDRSFVDIASYWLVRDFAYDFNAAKEVVEECQILSYRYDFHFYFPHDVISLKDDGYRSRYEEMRVAVGEQIESFLKDWNIAYMRLETDNIEDRANIVINQLNILKA